MLPLPHYCGRTPASKRVGRCLLATALTPSQRELDAPQFPHTFSSRHIPTPPKYKLPMRKEDTCPAPLTIKRSDMCLEESGSSASGEGGRGWGIRGCNYCHLTKFFVLSSNPKVLVDLRSFLPHPPHKSPLAYREGTRGGVPFLL